MQFHVLKNFLNRELSKSITTYADRDRFDSSDSSFQGVKLVYLTQMDPRLSHTPVQAIQAKLKAPKQFSKH